MSDRENGGPPNKIPDAVPEHDFYTNAVSFQVSTYEFALTFRLNTAGQRPDPLVTLRMSPQHAWVMSKLLERNVQAYIEQVGKFSLPEGLLEELNLEEEYNEDLGE